MTDATLPRIFVTVPGVEDLRTVSAYLRAAGAQITTRRREFVIEGPLTPIQAAALWRISRHRDGNSEGKQLELRVEPAGAVDSALRVLCPEGFDVRASLPPDGGNPVGWWDEQQRRQSRGEAWRPSPPPTPTCCGQGGAWAPRPGEPQVVGCMLCRNAGRRYWRNRADGQMYVPVKPLSE
ncbi:hypothetical protein [Phytohabitans houttuyneae]|uniref:Uncharacterized protein n=1 Tax=Phytohabitans houttuyneae TaxID=1076126 RepID=A0A6V8K2R3_9ACTN|nr:hypothetical protein [Phytohabitans houttuyneae]GFJ79423.1 hypothetical protein Phou_036030 [Phytohabitans houttuyneae]